MIQSIPLVQDVLWLPVVVRSAYLPEGPSTGIYPFVSEEVRDILECSDSDLEGDAEVNVVEQIGRLAARTAPTWTKRLSILSIRVTIAEWIIIPIIPVIPAIVSWRWT